MDEKICRIQGSFAAIRGGVKQGKFNFPCCYVLFRSCCIELFLEAGFYTAGRYSHIGAAWSNPRTRDNVVPLAKLLR